ncbi:MAG: hypothetical protein U9Q74_10415, partial [Gemmatimonadota bacterium]|nr:hypothetical protein [Gemmatimonadota bacterium]
SVGQELKLTLSTIGPGEYASPPLIVGTSVEFIDAAVVPPFTPGGPTQLFRFKAVRSGQAVIRFTHTERSPVVEDTVRVR